MIVIVLILLIINSVLILNKKECTYDIKTETYKENITVTISRFDKTNIKREYNFNNKEILEIEKEELENSGYNTETNDLDLVANKTEKKKDYYKQIKEYEEMGFICK